MGFRSRLRQLTQIIASDTYNDTLDMSTAENFPGHDGNIEQDLNFIRSQEKVITGEANWFDPPEMSLSQIALKTFSYWKQVTTDITVPATQNYVTLTGSEKPGENIAINTATLGAIVSIAQGSSQTLDASSAVDNGGGLVGIPLTGHGYSAGDSVTISGTTNYDGTYILDATTSVNEMVITATYVAETFLGSETVIKNLSVGSHSLSTANDLSNVIEIRDASTDDIIYVESAPDTDKPQIYGLLQVGVSATDGNPFGDSGNDQGQISFVYRDPSTEALVAVPSGDIEGKTIEFAYKVRTNYKNLPENAFDPTITFVENVALSTLDLQDVYDNDDDGEFVLSPGKDYTIDLNGNADVVIEDGATTFITFDQSEGNIEIGVDTEILNGSDIIMYDDDNSNSLTITVPSDLTSDLNWVYPGDAGSNGNVLTTDGSGNLTWTDPNVNDRRAYYIHSGAAIAKDSNVNISVFNNPDNINFGSSATEFVKDFIITVNGDVLLLGENASQDFDCYYVDANNIAFEENIANNDVIQVFQRALVS